MDSLETSENVSLDERLEGTRKMKSLLFQTKKELELQMDFIYDNMQLVHEKINTPAKNDVLHISSVSHRKLVNDLTNIHQLFKAEKNMVKTVSNALENFEEEQNNRVQQLKNLEDNILNIKNNVATYEMTLRRPCTR